MTAPYARPAARLSGVTSSRIRAIFDRAAELEARGTRVIHFEIGRPEFDTPQVVKDAAGAALAATSLDDVREGMNRLIFYTQRERDRAHV